VPLTASKKEIKSAFVSKVKLCHPDIYPDDKAKHQQFLKLHKAYEMLSQLPDTMIHVPMHVTEEHDFTFDREAVNKMSQTSSKRKSEAYLKRQARRAENERQTQEVNNSISFEIIVMIMVGALCSVGFNYLVREETKSERRARLEYEKNEEGQPCEDYFQEKARSIWFPLF